VLPALIGKSHEVKIQLVIRISFRHSPFPCPVAHHDLYTSQDYLEPITPKIALALQHLHQTPYPTPHIATGSK
jgi:hypothetical protein